MTVELIPDPEFGGLTARVPDIPAYGEGETEEEAVADLKVALTALGLDGVVVERAIYPAVGLWPGLVGRARRAD